MSPEYSFFDKNKKLISGFLYLILAVMVFFLGIHFSKDWYWYQNFNAYQIRVYEKRGLAEYFGLFKEPLYLFASVHISRLIGFPWFVFISTLSLLYLKLKSLDKTIGSPYVGVFFYSCIYLLLFDGTAIRTGFATAFIMYALLSLKNTNYYRATALIFIAGLIHLSSWMFFLLFPLYFYSRCGLVIVFAFFVSAVLLVFNIDIFEIIRGFLSLINTRYLEYGSATKTVGQNSTGLYFYFIAFYTTLLVVLWAYLKQRIKGDRFTRSIYLLALFSIPVMLAFRNHVAIGARLGELLLFPVVILLSWLDNFFSKNGMKLHRIILYSIFSIYFVARFVYLFPSAFSEL